MEQIRVMTKEEVIARACHEINRAYCAALCDISHQAWEATPEIIRNSAISGVKLHLEAGPHGVAPGTTHNIWLDYKMAEGWKWGPVKNIDTREHPCMLPFNDLPEHEQAKDFIFGAVVQMMREVM